MKNVDFLSVRHLEILKGTSTFVPLDILSLLGGINQVAYFIALVKLGFRQSLSVHKMFELRLIVLHDNVRAIRSRKEYI